MSGPWPWLRAPAPVVCPGRTCLFFGQEHEHAQPRDRVYEDLPVGHHWTYADGGSCGTVSRPVTPEEFMATAAQVERPTTIRMIGARRMQCKDIPDEVFLDAVRRAPGTPNCGWRMRWNVHELLEAEIGPVPENLLMAKARKLIARGLMGGCPCGCRGDWHPADECEVGACCRPREGRR